MQNCLVHHLTGTKLFCALPKCTSVQNIKKNLSIEYGFPNGTHLMEILRICFFSFLPGMDIWIQEITSKCCSSSDPNLEDDVFGILVGFSSLEK